jgi:hypothetical protein
MLRPYRNEAVRSQAIDNSPSIQHAVKITTLVVTHKSLRLEFHTSVEFLGITNAAPRGDACYPRACAPMTCLKHARSSTRIKTKQFRESFMMFTDWVRLIWILCLVTAGASSAQAQMESHEKFVCTSGPVKRVVAIFDDNGKRKSGGCRVDYTKDGETRTVWTSKNNYAYCVAKAVLLVTKLAEGNFSCKPETVEPPDEIDPPEQAPATQSHPE